MENNNTPVQVHTLKERLEYAFPRTLPVMFGYLFLGIAFGIVLEEAGYNFIWAFFISLFVYAGSMQFVMVPMLVAAVSPVTMAVTTLFVNSRHLFYGLSFVESFKKLKSYFYMVFSLTDETYSVLCGCKNLDPKEEHRDSWFLISVLDHSYWITGSVIGGLLGQALPIDFTGIDFSMTALFAVILLEQILTDKKNHIIPAVSGCVVATVCLLIFGVDKFLLPTLIITVMIIAGYTRFSGDAKKDMGGVGNE